MLACQNGHESCAGLLISNGANLDAKDNTHGMLLRLVSARVALVSCLAFAVDKGGSGDWCCTVRTGAWVWQTRSTLHHAYLVCSRVGRLDPV